MSVEHNAELTRSTKRWREVRLWYKSGATLDGVFSFKRESLAPLLRKEGVSYAFILDEPEFVLARMELDSEGEARLTVELESVVRTSTQFSKVTFEEWSPVQDARTRIVDALARLRAAGGVSSGLEGPGWQVLGRDSDGTWKVGNQEFDEKVADFARFMSEVAGRFTLAYLQSMPRRVEDRWLKSLFVHLLLDSVSTPQNEEAEIRAFPYI